MNRWRRWFAGVAGTVLAVTVAGAVLASAAEVASAVTISSPSGTIGCGGPVTVTATILDGSSEPIVGQQVDWTFDPSSPGGAEIGSTPTTTDTNGVASTTVTLACVAGPRTLTATADGISGSAVLAITADGLPRTSTDWPPLMSLPIATLLALLAALFGGSIIIRRFAFGPR